VAPARCSKPPSRRPRTATAACIANTCFSRQRQGTARCDQQRLPAGPLENAILAEALAALEDGSIFEAAAQRAQQAWLNQHSGRQAELAGARGALQRRQSAIDRYLRAFEAGRLPESICAHRLAELDQEVQALAARTLELEAACETTPAMVSGDDLAEVRPRDRAGSHRRRSRAAQAAVGQRSGRDRGGVEGCIQPYFVAPTVRVRTGSRRRTGIEPA
jgi:hypothetical protein